MGLKKPLFLKVETASVTESQIASFRPGATVRHRDSVYASQRMHVGPPSESGSRDCRGHTTISGTKLS